MSRIPIASLANGVLFATQSFASPSNPSGVPVLTPAVGTQCFVYIHDTATPAAIWTDELGSVPLAQPLTTDETGTVPGWIDTSLLPLDLIVALPSGNETFVLAGGGGGGGGGAVGSVFGRTGSITAQTGDYTATQVGADAAGAAAAVSSALSTETGRAQTAEALLAPKASPALTGTPTAPTATVGTNTTQLATTAFVQANAGGTPGGDASGTVANLTVNTVQGGKTPLNTASFLGLSQIVRPSGDATGATDLANINAALAGGTNTSVYLNGNYKINGSISIPGGMTLILADASIQRVTNVVPMIVNAHPNSTGDTGIHIRGHGRAIFDFNGTGIAENVAQLKNQSPLLYVNVSDFSIDGVEWRNTVYVDHMLQVCSAGRITRHRGTNPQGNVVQGLSSMLGCTDIVYDGVTGNYTDSTFSIAAGNNNAGEPGYYSTYAATLANAQLACSHITMKNVHYSSATQTGVNLIVVGTGTSITDIVLDNIHNTSTSALQGYLLWVGPAGYSGASNPSPNSISGIRISNVTMATGHILLALDDGVSDVVIDGVSYSNNASAGWPPSLIKNVTALPSGYVAGVSNVKISNVKVPQLSGALMTLPANFQVTGLELRDIYIDTVNAALLSNTSNVTDLKATFHVGTLNASPFQSTGQELGEVSLTYATKGGSLSKVLTNPVPFKIVQPFPALASADATPLPVFGSQVLAHNTKDPTGGAGTTGGLYGANGLGWTQISSGGGAFRPGQLYQPLLCHFSASAVLGVADGGAVTTWPDSAYNNFLTQPTSAARPTWKAVDTHLNNLPSVVFNGSTQYIQNNLVGPIVSSQPFSLFIVWYFTALGAGNLIVWDGGSAAAGSGSDGPFLFGNNVPQLKFNATSSITDATVPAINTAYITAAVMNSTTVDFGENKAAFASLTVGSAGIKTISGFTLGGPFSGGSSFGAVNVAECFLYQGLISTTDYATVMAGLAAKYAVTLV